MNLFLSCLVSLLVCSVISIQSTTSASFPNLPTAPALNAPREEWILFWKLMKNYYAIIARPRYGKRYDSITTESKLPSLLEIINPNSESSSSSETMNNYRLSENYHHVNNDQQINSDDVDEFIHPNRQRR